MKNLSIKVEHLKDGDIILLPGGKKARVVGARTTERKIPSRKVKHSLISLEVEDETEGNITMSHMDMIATASKKVDIVSRSGFAWKRDQFIKKHRLYVNALAGTFTSVVITTVLTATGVVTSLGGGYMLVASALLGVALIGYAYVHSK